MVRNYLITALLISLWFVAEVPTQAQNTPIDNTDVRWSSDGTKIVFSSNRSSDYDIWIMDADGQNQINLTSEMASDQIVPVWSPDGERILFANGNGWEEQSLWVMNADGTDKTEIVSESENLGSYKWSADSNYVAYQMDPYGQPSFWIVNPENLAQHQFVPDIEDDELLTYMFWTTEELDVEYDVDYIPVADNLYLAVLYHYYMGPNRPCILDGWCLHNTDGTIQVSSRQFETDYVLNVRSNSDIITAHSGELALVIDAALYPDGRVAFVTRHSEVRNLWLLDARTGDMQLILPGSGTNVYFDLRWSPDGTEILFTWQAERNDGADLWLINADGTNVRNLTCDNTQEHCVR